MQSSELTALTEEHIGDLAPVSIRQPVGTFALTPASLLSLRAVSERADLLEGRGLDWGCGTGCLAIVAAKTPGVESLVGIDISQSNVAAAEGNAALNGVHNKTTFVRADSYRAATKAGRAVMNRIRGRLDFIIGNPPGGETGDGLTLRRAMLSGAPEFLKPKDTTPKTGYIHWPAKHMA
jgi:tRNA1(Val) A37 N6-methylase TrmN6